MKKLVFGVCVAMVFMSGLFRTTHAKANDYEGMIDYGDAPGYETTSHWTGYWQRLGHDLTTEDAPRLDDGDDGVFWSTDGGATWGNEPVTIGSDVIFRFDVQRSGFGEHDYDQLKAWVDWNQDGYWDNEDEQVIALQWFKDTPEDGDTRIPDGEYHAYVAEHGVAPNPDAVLEKSFYATVTIPETMEEGDTWLRARVTCWHTPFEQTNPYDFVEQGEVEDWKLTVQAVPEPATVVLMCLGVAGLAVARRRRRRQ